MGVSEGLLGALIGSIAGAVFGNKIGIAGFGNAINGSIPCAIIGGITGGFVGDKIGHSCNKPMFPKEGTPVPPTTDDVKKIESNIENHIAHFRKSYGIPITRHNNSLSIVARYKSQEMKETKTVSIDSKSYGDLSNMITGFGVIANEIGMALGKGYKSTNFSIWDWLNNPKIKNIFLNSNYEEIGVGYVDSTDGGYFTVLFLKK